MVRSVKCWDSVTQLEIDDQYCTEDKPTNVSICKHPSCPEWSIGRWEDVSTSFVLQAIKELFSRCFFFKHKNETENNFTNTIKKMQCKSDCTKSRQVTCQYHNGEVDERLCSADTKPKTVGMCCRFKWRLKWSPVTYNVVIVK